MTPVDGAEDFGWDGEAGLRWLRDMDRMERMLGAFTPYLLDAARIKPGDRVADIGCGGGETTRRAARRAARGRLLGVDVSQQLIDRARELTGVSGTTCGSSAPTPSATGSERARSRSC